MTGKEADETEQETHRENTRKITRSPSTYCLDGIEPARIRLSVRAAASGPSHREAAVVRRPGPEAAAATAGPRRRRESVRRMRPGRTATGRAVPSSRRRTDHSCCLTQPRRQRSIDEVAMLFHTHRHTRTSIPNASFDHVSPVLFRPALHVLTPVDVLTLDTVEHVLCEFVFKPSVII